MYASYIGHDVVVSELLEGGANVNNKNSKGQTPLCLAASCGNCNVSQRLLQVFVFFY
jgi:ankyrin repeat protein